MKKNLLLALFLSTSLIVLAQFNGGAGDGFDSKNKQTPFFLPILTTTPISSITLSGASSGGNITSQGGSAVTARGVVWSTTTAPTLTSNEAGHTTNGTGTGSFTSSITGLTQSTIYYVRAYATNAQGTAYGEERMFTTIPTLPEWGLIVLGSLIAVFAVRKIVRMV